jgi:nucleotide-binding universal stress UspA family protein
VNPFIFINAIVIGQRGLSPIKGLLLGSLTRQVLSLAQRMTIFVVGQEATFTPDCPISPLLLPLDGSEPSLTAVRYGAALAQRFKEDELRLTLLHVIDYVLLGTAYAVGRAPLIEEGKKVLRNSRKIFEEARLREPAVEKLNAGDPSKVVAKVVEDDYYALILMGARGGIFLETTGPGQCLHRCSV